MLDRRRNPEATGLWAALGLLLVGISLIVVPGLAGLEGMEGGFALAAFGLLLVLTGLITLAMMLPRAARMRDMLAERNLLARWAYDPLQLEAEAERIGRQWSERNRSLFAIVLAWMVVICGIFVAFMLLSDQADDLPLFLGIMGGVTLIVAAFAFGMPYVMARQARRSRNEALIGPRSLYFGGTLYTWGSPLERLDGVELLQDHDGTRVAFRLSSRSAPYLQFLPYLVEVPVPPGADDEATALVERLQS